ncbi:MAG TPA: GDSL-type esterase/lipase family protein, partial [Planctomycetota bacterium]|nr:GDSL-type esterase/lipase family protein [Planctomycetota bacterium]
AGPGADELARMAYRPLPYLMWGLKPNWTREPGPRNLVRTSNSLGFRGREVELPKPEGRYRLICFGGSTTYDDALSDDETNVVQLEGLLRAARPAQDIELVNAGVPSYTSAEDLPNLAFRCLDLQPDAILIYQGINDFRTRGYRNFDPAYFHYRKIWDGGTRTWVEGEGELGGINAFIQHKPPEPNGDQAENVRRAGTGAYRRNLTSMAGIAKAHGVRCIFVTSIIDKQNEYVTPVVLDGIAEQNEVMRQVAAEQGVLLVDLAAVYPSGDYFVDAVHNNAAGATEKARIIADGLLRDLFP